MIKIQQSKQFVKYNRLWSITFNEEGSFVFLKILDLRIVHALHHLGICLYVVRFQKLQKSIFL